MEGDATTEAGVRTDTVQASSDVATLWVRWCKGRNLSDRDDLVETYTPFVRMLAAKCYANRITRGLEFADYLQFGLVGLIEAIERFDASYGVRFETFGGYRIQGAILNGVENLSEVQKQLSVRRQMVRERNASLASGTNGKEESALEKLASVAIGLAIGFVLEDSGIYETSERTAADSAYAKVELRQLRQQIAELVRQLSDQQRTVIHRHYFQQVPFEQIALAMQLTKGRISQIHKAAIERLRLLRTENASFCVNL